MITWSKLREHSWEGSRLYPRMESSRISWEQLPGKEITELVRNEAGGIALLTWKQRKVDLDAERKRAPCPWDSGKPAWPKPGRKGSPEWDSGQLLGLKEAATGRPPCVSLTVREDLTRCPHCSILARSPQLCVRSWCDGCSGEDIPSMSDGDWDPGCKVSAPGDRSSC